MDARDDTYTEIEGGSLQAIKVQGVKQSSTTTTTTTSAMYARTWDTEGSHMTDDVSGGGGAGER